VKMNPVLLNRQFDYRPRLALPFLIALLAIAAPLCADDDPPVEAATQDPSAEANAEEAAADKAPQEKPQPKLLPWLDSIQAGYREAREKQRPIFFRAGGEDCPWCEVLDEDIAKPAAQEELERWTRVKIDIAKSPQDADAMWVGPIPALRLVTPGGKIIASHDGALTAVELAAWLEEHYEAAAALPPPELVATGEPSDNDVVRIMTHFERRDAMTREAAIRRLAGYPHAAATATVKVLRKGSLAEKLAALELLQIWQAPVDKLDPWTPQSFNDERLAALDAWVKKTQTAEFKPSPIAASFDGEQRLEIEEAIAKMLEAEPAEAGAIRERLARFGAALLPEVYKQLKEVQGDRPRERLTMLRYRLVADDELALNWTGGSERRSSSDVSIRSAAADKLAERAGEDDERLLLELFSDPAPLVREIVLKALRKTSGNRSNSTLIELLADPDPNVRAAVLKELAENPSKLIVPKIEQYVKQEKDADLIVHAARIFREARGDQSVLAAIGLLNHESWRVRAEAAESIRDIIKNDDNLRSDTKNKAYAEFIKLLDDRDGFVVSRGVAGLARHSDSAAIKPLANAAERHPELAGEVVQALTRGGYGNEVDEHLRRLCRHESPLVRAAAIGGLCSNYSGFVEAELAIALKDADSRVRIAAGQGFFGMFDADVDMLEAFEGEVFIDEEAVVVTEQKSILGALVDGIFGGASPAGEDIPFETVTIELEDDNVTEEELRKRVEQVRQAEEGNNTEILAANNGEKSPDNKTEEAPDPDQRLLAIRQGKIHERWKFDMVPLLTPMLKADTAEERLAAALPLTALGKDELAFPALEEISQEHPNLRPEVARGLPWLLWADRKRMFEQLTAESTPSEQLSQIVEVLSDHNDPRNPQLFLQLLKEDDRGMAVADVIEEAMRHIYFKNKYYNPKSATSSQKKEAREKLKPMAAEGPRWQRMIALVILTKFSPSTALELAEEIASDETASAELRADAFQIQLTTETKLKAEKTAVAAMQSEVPEIRRRAIRFLVLGAEKMYYIGKSGLYTDVHDSHTRKSSEWATSLIEIKPPNDLTQEAVQAIADESEELKLSAFAGYLLALFGDDSGLEDLIKFHKSLDPDETLDRLLFRAIAAVNATTKVPLLEEIYARMEGDEQRIREFYWTIRNMSGPEILAFRKKIRNDVGMGNLR